MIHDRRWSQDRAANDPQKGPEMILVVKHKWSRKENQNAWFGLKSLTHNIWTRKCVFRKLSEVSAVHQYHDHVLKFQKDGYNDNLYRKLSLIFATYLWEAP